MTNVITNLIEVFERDYGVKIQYGVRPVYVGKTSVDYLCSVIMRRGKFFSRVDNLNLLLKDISSEVESEFKKILYEVYSRLLNVELDKLNNRR